MIYKAQYQFIVKSKVLTNMQLYNIRITNTCKEQSIKHRPGVQELFVIVNLFIYY